MRHSGPMELRTECGAGSKSPGPHQGPVCSLRAWLQSRVALPLFPVCFCPTASYLFPLLRLLKQILPLSAAQLSLSARLLCRLSTWDSTPHSLFHALFLPGPLSEPILVAVATLQRVPGGSWGQGTSTAAASTISNAGHPRGALAEDHFGGHSWPPQASKASH